MFQREECIGVVDWTLVIDNQYEVFPDSLYLSKERGIRGSQKIRVWSGDLVTVFVETREGW